eukprot:2080094-Prymnesium_polylepis.2
MARLGVHRCAAHTGHAPRRCRSMRRRLDQHREDDDGLRAAGQLAELGLDARRVEDHLVAGLHDDR